MILPEAGLAHGLSCLKINVKNQCCHNSPLANEKKIFPVLVLATAE